MPGCPCLEDDCGDILSDFSIQGTQSIVCDGYQFFVSNNTTATNVAQYIWDWGDTTSDITTTTQDVSHIYNIPDSLVCDDDKTTYVICLTIVRYCDNNAKLSCHNTSKPVGVIHRPRALFSAPEEACINTPVTLTNTSCNATVFHWDFGDGTTSDLEDPTKTYTAPGNYTVTLTVTNTTCGSSDTETRMIRVVGYPEASFTLDADPADRCGPTIIAFDDQSNQWSNTYWTILPPEMSGWDFTDTSMTLSTNDIEVAFEPGMYDVTLTAENICGEDTSHLVLNIYEPLHINLDAPPGFCDAATISSSDLNFSYSGTITGIKWTFTGSSNMTTSSDPTFSGAIFNTSGTVTLEVASPCGNLTETVPIVVATTEQIVMGSNPAEICNQADPIQLSAAPPGGNWTGLGPAAGAVSSTGVFDPSGLIPGTYSLNYSIGAAGCPNDMTINIAVLPTVGVALAGVNPACESLNYVPNVQFSGNITNYAWTLEGANPPASSASNPTASFTHPDTAMVVVMVNGQCGTASDTIFVEIQANADPMITPPQGPLCSGSTPITLQVNPGGGTWSGTGITDPVNGVFNPGVGQGNYLIIYSLLNGVCTGLDSINLTVISSPSVSFPADTLCIDSAPMQLSASPGGGGFSGPGVDSLTGIFDPAQAGEGSLLLHYSYTSAAGCEVMAAAQFLVEALPILTLPDTLDLCLSDIPVDLAAVSGYMVSPGGASVWSGPGVINPSGIFNGGAQNLQEGNYTVSVAYTRNECQVEDSLTIRLILAPDLAIRPDTTVCISDQFLQLETNLSGGAWSGPGVEPATGLIHLEDAGGGIFTYGYLFSPETNCRQEASLTVEIIDLGANLNPGPDIEICEGPATYTLTGASPAGGYWTGPPALTDPQTGLIDLSQIVPDSVYVFSYCLESESVLGCSACKSRTFVLHANPAAAFALAGSACEDEVFGLVNTTTGASTYSWDFGDGTPGSAQFEPTHTYSEPGDYTITLTATNPVTGCFNTTVRDVHVTAPPVAAFDLTSDEGCAPFLVGIDDHSSGEGLSLTWYIGPDTILGAAPTGIYLDHITKDSYFIIRVMASNLCADRFFEDTVLVHPYPVVRFGVQPNEGCSPLSVGLANTTVGNPETWFWDYAVGTSTDSLPPLPIIYTAPDTNFVIYPITLISANECGADTLTKEVIVYPPDVTAFLEADTLKGCQPLTVQLESFATPGSIITWRVIGPDDAEQGSALENPQFILNTPGIHTVILYAARCGEDTDTTHIEVLPAPDVSFTHRPVGCLGQPIQFNNLSVGISGSEWDFGDGNTSSDHSPVHMFAAAGTYTVTLTAYSLLNACPATFTSTVEVVGNPVAAFTPSVTEGCGPLEVAFDNNSQGGVHYVWNWSDGTSASFLENPVHIFQSPGNYEVRLTVFNQDSCFTDTAVFNILVYPDPVAGFTLPAQNYCLGYDNLLPVNTSQGAVAYEWSWPGGSSTGVNPVIVPSQSGTLPVTLVAVNSFQCRDSLIRAVDILPSPVAGFAPDMNQGCEDLRVVFDNQSQFAGFYDWDFADGNGSALENPANTFTSPGEYAVTLVAGSDNGCPQDTFSLNITVWPKPTAEFTYDKPEECGTPAEVILTNGSNGYVGSDWAFGDGAFSTDTDPVHDYQQPGVFPIRLVVTNEFLCKDTVIQEVDIFGQPAAGFDPGVSVGCNDLEVVFQNQSTDAVRYIWRIASFPEFRDSISPRVVFTEPGVYTAELVAIYNDQCQDTYVLPTPIRVYRSPEAGFETEIDRDENLLGDVQFINTSEFYDRIHWDFGDGNTSTETDPFHVYDINRSITVTLIAYNDNNGAYTCTDTLKKPVDPEWITTFFAPNALSPDFGPLQVRIFKPVGIGIEEYEIAIYSPYGKQVWHSTALEDGHPKDGWDGTLNGKPQPQGAYVWRADLKFVNGDRRVETGSVNLVR
ncbi:MAG TPA: PKD domain-containing protein [Flavilitoribacter sp.]|nr:PKD domain-containing protein [Flavilitoribacter sp.]